MTRNPLHKPTSRRKDVEAGEADVAAENPTVAAGEDNKVDKDKDKTVKEANQRLPTTPIRPAIIAGRLGTQQMSVLSGNETAIEEAINSHSNRASAMPHKPTNRLINN